VSKTMTGRERVLATLNRQPADRIPFDLGGTTCSGIHAMAYKRLRGRLGLPDRPLRCACPFQLIAQVDEDVQDALGCDAELLAFGSRETKTWSAPFGIDLVVPGLFDVEDLPDGSSVLKNRAGDVYAKRAADACFFDLVGCPLAGVTSADQFDDFDAVFERWDYPYVFDEPIEALADRARRQYESTHRAVVAPWQLHYLQAGQLLRGYEQFFLDLAGEKQMAHAVLGKVHAAYMRRLDLFLPALADSMDAVFLLDDLGTQQAGLISPATYREMILPYTSATVAKIKSFGKKIIMHSCGAIAAFIPMLIEMGIDAINPVQVSARGMNPRDLVRQFGKDVAFWGGGCDTQHALNAADPQVVREDVRRRLDEFGPDAHLVFTQVHNIQYDVSPENIMAMHEEFCKRTRNM
jgi:uroporphyrinogen decarboxylase